MTAPWAHYDETGGLADGASDAATGDKAPATRDVVYAAATTLLIGALLCAVTGAVNTTRQQRGSSDA